MNSRRTFAVRPLLCCLPFMALPALGGAQPLTINQALERAGDGAGVRAANAQMQARYAERAQRSSESGWEMFGNANVGRYHELVTEDLRNDYYGRSLAVGVRYPLLGSLRKRLDAVHDSDRDASLAQIEQGYRRAQQRLAVRSAYADWWRASEELRLCKGVPQAAREAESQLAERLANHWVLPSDAQLIRSQWQAISDRCALQGELIEDVRASLNSLGVPLQAGDTPVAAALADHPQGLQAWAPQLNSNPRIAGRDTELANAERRREQPWYTAIDSYFNVTQSFEQRSGAADNGSGLAVGLTFSAPVDLLDYGSSRKREGEARYQAAVQAREQEQGDLLRELGKVIAQQRRSVNEYQRLNQRREGLQTLLAERRQRGSLDAGDASMALQQAQIDDYNAGFAQISAWHRVWLQEAALRLFGDDSQAFDALLGASRLQWQQQRPTTSSTQPAWSQGVYIWESQALLDPARRSAELARLRSAGMHQLNLGLNRHQVQDLGTTRAQLADLLRAAHGQGMQVNLLLGDPNWILPAHRSGLLNLVRQLASLPFDGVHLDLEVEQLGWPVPEQRLSDWLQTLREARAASAWPLMLSSHPRWFEGERSDAPCVPCELEKIGVAQVSLMIYTRSADKSTQRALDIARRWPALKMRLAQSVEVDQSPRISWAGSSHGELQQQTRHWQDALRPAGLNGIDWQSWTDFPRSR